MEKKRWKKMLYILLGSISLGVGALGAVLPVLPTVPFLLVSACCFGKGSEHLQRWFLGTKLYQKNLESYSRGEGMIWKVKIRIIIIVTLTMGIGFLMMGRVPVGRWILGIIWLGHLIYFLFGVKTISEPRE